MAFNQQGGGFNGNNQARRFDSTYYSRIYFMNPDTNTRVNITYSSGLMKLTIATSNGESGQNGYRNWEDQITVSLTGTKATLLLKSIEKYEKDIAESNITMNNAYGVVTGMGEVQTIIQFHLNKVNTGKAFTIFQINAGGNIIKKCTFDFPDNYDYRLEWSNKDAMQYEKVFEPELQYEMFKQALKEFSETCNGAAGYNAVDLARYDINNIKNLLNAIGTQVGIPVNNNHGGGYNRNSSGGFFGNNQNNNSNSQSTHKSLDQIQSEYLSDEEE